MFNTEQIQAINHVDGNCCVVACAGSGKTTVITHRAHRLICLQGIDPRSLLIITFSKQSKKLIKARLSELMGNETAGKISIETFHSFAYKLIRKTGQDPVIMTPIQRKKILADILCGDMQISKHYDEIDFAEITEFLATQKNHLLLPEDGEKIKLPISAMLGKQDMAEIYRRYEESRARQNLIDFDDMIADAYKLLLGGNGVLEFCRQTYQYIMIDEMQDINFAQYEMIRMINEKRNNLFVVGDALQNIYEWRDANGSYLLNFKEQWPDAEEITLFRNYRSTKGIVELANYLVDGLKETRHSGYRPAVSDVPAVGQSAYWELYEDEYEEAASASEFIDYMVNSVKQRQYRDFAVLTRTNSQLLLFENELYKRGIPFENISDTMFFENKEIDLLVGYLKLAVNEDNNEAFLKVYNKPNRWIGKVLFEKIKETAKNEKVSLYKAMLILNNSTEHKNSGIVKLQEIIAELKDESVDLAKRINQLRFVANINKYAQRETTGTSNTLEKLENIERFEDLASKFRSTMDFLEHITALINFEKGTDENAVSLSTIHKAKGTEFPAVFITGLNEQIFPHKKTLNIEEETRLLYVGITRAKEELYMSSVVTYGNQKYKISRFATLLFGDDVQKALSKRAVHIPFTTSAKDGLIKSNQASKKE